MDSRAFSTDIHPFVALYLSNNSILMIYKSCLLVAQGCHGTDHRSCTTCSFSDSDAHKTKPASSTRLKEMVGAFEKEHVFNGRFCMCFFQHLPDLLGGQLTEILCWALGLLPHRLTKTPHCDTQVAMQSQIKLPKGRQLCSNTAARQWVRMAPLGPPNSQMIRYAKLDSWALLVVELEGTPQNWRTAFDSLWEASAAGPSQAPPNLVFLDRTTQQQLGFASGGCSDSEARSKNIGSLFAIMCGADVIIEAEEGVEHVEAAGQLPLQAAASEPFLQALGDPSSRLINPYALFGHPEIWPAVFPPAAVNNATFEFRKVQQPPDQDGPYQPLIQSALVDDYPATDAVLGLTQLAHKGPQRFYSKPAAIGVQPGYFAPLGLGSTVYRSDAFWGLLMHVAPNQALAPAWRSLWVQKLLWGVGGQLLILAPSARQNRTVRALQLEAQVQEMEGYSKTGTLVDFLHHWESNEKMLDLRMLQLARDLRSAGFWSQAEVGSMGAWVADLRAAGYMFPDVLVPKQQAVIPAEGARTKKLAAFCFTGQADRAPEAIPATLSQLQKLLTAESTSQEAMQLAETLEHSRTEDGSILFAHDTFAYVSTHESCGDHIRWIAQQPFTFSILYNDPLLEVPQPLDPARFGGNAVVPMLYQMHAQHRCFEMIQEYSREHGVEYSVVVRLRTDHQLHSLADDSSNFALWSKLSLTAVVVPQPEWDFSDIIPATGGYQDRIGWGPVAYMQIYMSRWSQFFNRTHMESDAPFHGESSLRYALTSAGVPVERLSDDQLQYLEVPHSELKCEIQEARRTVE